MATTDPGSAREEAERLVAMFLAAARLAAATPGGGQWGPLGGILSGVLGHTSDGAGSGDRTASAGGAGFATGSPECSVCPICRGIAALRDPSPEFAERLATGAGDLAAGVASLLRAFAPAEPAGPAGADEPAAGSPAGDHVWRAATRTGHDSQPAPEQDVWSAATRGEGVADPGAAVPPADAAGPDVPVSHRPPVGRPVVPVARASGEVAEEAPGDGA
ncbi:hypothetical protein ONA91_36455 [Micromonospora sp. DR5-3]|uniref:hypothetical protein n=1 Tax=unclassified Micromonospora TaxID=2617518 RepID=UPI0011DAAAC9|nr:MULTISPECIES: hypothetical protein [unclassified Micromonospora]MCW3819941.1 hypothetical protein [Micromonospora sp. DR5-3]TYC19987.1 hypothetical protein FXF52_33670 [Micromonospora sp. MP36]